MERKKKRKGKFKKISISIYISVLYDCLLMDLLTAFLRKVQRVGKCAFSFSVITLENLLLCVCLDSLDPLAGWG